MAKDKSTLGKLARGDQEKIFEHCEPITLEAAVGWLKAGWDIKLSTKALSVWLGKMRSEEEFNELLAEIRADSEKADIVGESLGNLAGMNEANIKMLSQALFAAQRTKNAKAIACAATGLAMVVEALAKDKSSTASVISAETSRNRFQFDAAKAALKAAGDLQDIQKSKGSEREKIDRAIERLFGKRPNEAKA